MHKMDVDLVFQFVHFALFMLRDNRLCKSYMAAE
jgi:hypothetical protein